jgi:hypothetical protein
VHVRKEDDRQIVFGNDCKEFRPSATNALCSDALDSSISKGSGRSHATYCEHVRLSCQRCADRLQRRYLDSPSRLAHRLQRSSVVVPSRTRYRQQTAWRAQAGPSLSLKFRVRAESIPAVEAGQMCWPSSLSRVPSSRERGSGERRSSSAGGT